MDIIPTKAYLYPGDQAAIQVVSGIPGLEKLIAFISKNSMEKYFEILYTSTYLRLTEKTSPRIFAMYQQSCERFGVERMPEVFLQRSYQCDTVLLGVEQPKILVSSSLLELLNENELEIFLSSDIAAIKAGHGLMGLLLMTASTYGGVLPIPKETVLYPLYQWKKQSYYTHDRARLLYSDNFDLAVGLVECGQTPTEIASAMTLESRLEQCEEFLRINGGAGMSKTLQTINSARPWNASRILELYNWKESGAYGVIKEGNYGQI